LIDAVLAQVDCCFTLACKAWTASVGHESSGRLHCSGIAAKCHKGLVAALIDAIIAQVDFLNPHVQCQGCHCSTGFLKEQ